MKRKCYLTRGMGRHQKFEFHSNQVEEGCWVWSGAINGRGRPELWHKGTSVRAHRYAYEYYKEEITEGMYVCHTCDNIRCVNPSHLFLGTQDDNMKDMVKKGRQALHQGTENGNAVLNDHKVKLIRLNADRMSLRTLSRIFKVGEGAINSVILRKSWTHVE